MMEKLIDFHLLFFYILAGIPLFFGVFLLFKNASIKAKRIFLYSFLAMGNISLIIFLVAHCLNGEHILAQLPLHLCYIALIVFIPLALFTKKKIFSDFIFYINSPTALFAIFFPARDYVDGAWSIITFTYVSLHYAIIFIPIWMFMWKMYNPYIKLVRALSILGILLVLSLIMHGLNVLLVKNGVAAANYFWTLVENAKYNVSILRLFATLVPYDYFYIAAFAAPILFSYIGIWHLYLVLSKNQRKKSSQKK